MKYILSWVAFCAFVFIGIPLLINGKINVNKGTNPKPMNQKMINVYFNKKDDIVTMNEEEYILGVLMAEMPAEFELEALKAQSVAARTYLYSTILSGDKSTLHKGGDICTDSSHCQAYISVSEAKEKWGKNARTYLKKCKIAVEGTNGTIACYDNEPINAVFHAFSGGKTENASDVWGGEVKYLKSVESPGDLLAPKFNSHCEIPWEEFKKIMSENFSCNFEENFIGSIENTTGGAVKNIAIGDKVIRGTDIRKTFNLKSACFTVEPKNNMVIFNVKGYGHGVGMSQYGANYYAKKGKKYDEILKKYYSGIEIINVSDKGINFSRKGNN